MAGSLAGPPVIGANAQFRRPRHMDRVVLGRRGVGFGWLDLGATVVSL
jgi:hypothetical protein